MHVSSFGEEKAYEATATTTNYGIDMGGGENRRTLIFWGIFIGN